MNFVALRSEGRMSIENQVLPLPVANWITDPSIEILSWNGDEGRGRIEYSDRKRLFTKIGFGNYFNEPVLADYILIIDEWMRRAAASGLTLQQAKQLRNELVDALYENKRIQPYPYGGYWYNATDKALRGMITLSSGSGSSGLVGSVGGLVDSINTALANKRNHEIWYIIDHYNAYGADHSVHLQNSRNSAWWQLQPGFSVVADSRFPGGNPWTYAQPGFFSAPLTDYAFNDMNQTPAFSASAGGGAAIAWSPLNATAQVSIPYATFSAALAGILSRRQNFDARKIAIKNSISAQTTIANVIAVDVTSGW